MTYSTTGTNTITGWLTNITTPKRKYYQVVGDRHLLVGDEEYNRAYRVYVQQKRKEKSPVFIVLCPESNCKILVQSNGGVRGAKRSATWIK